MDDADRRGAKRSRFDQTERDPAKRPSRFDRRSRSPPPHRAGQAVRERSPKEPGPSSPRRKTDAAEAAAAAAARINDKLQARGPASNGGPSTGSAREPAPAAFVLNSEIYIDEGDYIRDIDVNDLRIRYVLTRGATAKKITDETGADVTVRGSYLPDKSMASALNPPLHLHVTSTSRDGIEKAIAVIEDMMKQDLPNLVDERRFRRQDQRDQQPIERDELGRRKWPEEKVYISLEPVPGFNLRAQIVGHGGAYVKHIQQETGCRVQIKGRGSGYTELATGRESDEVMHLHVAGPDPNMVQKGKELCEDLLQNVVEQHEEFKSRPPRRYGDRGYDRGHDDRGGYGQGGNYGGYSNHSSRGSNQNYRDSPRNGADMRSPGHGSPGADQRSPDGGPGGPGTGGSQSQQAHGDANSQYAQYYNSNDPYAAYGGYAAYCQYYQHYYAEYAKAQAQAQQSGEAPPSMSNSAPGSMASAAPPPPGEAPPPPPPSGDGPPPPPSGAPGTSTAYNAIPPPPGL